MKKLLVVLMVLLAFNAFAQNPSHTVDFEPGGVGSGWDWTVFDYNPSLTEISNPVSGGINASATVMEFVADPSDEGWTGCWTIEDGEFTFDATNSAVSIMVHKDVISVVKIKLEGMSPPIEVDATNTGTGTWELLTYDFSAAIGNTYNKLVIFPDFNFSRTSPTTSYFDNIVVPDGVVTGPLPEPTTVPPTPPHAAANVISIYSDTYTDVPGTNFNPNWGQSTSVTVDYVAAGNNTLKYENLNYQGTEYSNQDVSLFENLHVDFWTPNSTDLGIYLISPGAETEHVFTITTEAWVSVDIPLTDFVPPVNLGDVFQFKVEGNGTVYLDNLYFWKSDVNPLSDATLSDLRVDGTTVPGFSPGVLSYDVTLPFGTTVVPTVEADPNYIGASVVIIDAPSLPGTTSVEVTSADLSNMLIYNVNFTVSGPEPTTVPPTPPHAEEDVISIYSDTYPNVPGTNYNPAWGQSTIVTVDYVVAGNNTLKYENLDYQGTEFTSQDVSGYDNLHVDFWTTNSTMLDFYLISSGPIETPFTLSITPNTWVSVDIALSAFAPVDLADVFQFKVVGDGDVFFDNLYFWKEDGPSPYPTHTINFETPFGVGADWTWVVAENDDNPPLEIIANPVSGGINSTLTVAKFTARVTGNPWALCFTDNDGEFTFNADNSTVKIMVYKAVVSDVAIKFEGMSGSVEIAVANSLTNQWEELEYDFSASIGNTYNKLIIIPDNDMRTQENIIYFDNIEAPDGVYTPPPPEPTIAAPDPTQAQENVTSIYSDEYTAPGSVNYFPNWGQSTAATEELIDGNNTLKYAGLNYQGTTFDVMDVSSMEFLHVDYWTSDGSLLRVSPISIATGEAAYDFGALTIEGWESVDIPITYFTDLGMSFTDIHQIKFDTEGTPGLFDLGTFFIDNVYFWKTPGLRLDLTVFLEGPFNGFNMNTSLNPSLIPEDQPYNTTPWNYNGTESFEITPPNAQVVDWLLIELRDAPSPDLATSGTMIDRQAAFLLQNGDVVGLDGESTLTFDISISESLFVVVWHRNHLGILSAYSLEEVGGVYSYNFSTGSDKAFGGNLKSLGLGIWGMYGGNGLADEQIDDLDKTSVWEVESGQAGYLQGDFNMDGQVDNIDKNDFWLENNGITSDEYQLIWQDEFDVDGSPAPEN